MEMDLRRERNTVEPH